MIVRSCPACQHYRLLRRRKEVLSSLRAFHTFNDTSSAPTTSLRPQSRDRQTRLPWPIFRQRRLYASAASAGSAKGSVAILGGGITGLATAHFLSKAFKNFKITIYESQDITGGWLRSNTKDVGDGVVTFEQGPKSLRPVGGINADLMLKLIEDIGLTDEVVVPPPNTAASHNRFIYYPDHLVRAPGKVLGGYPGMWLQGYSLLTEPVFKKVVSAALTEGFREQRDLTMDDESVSDFITRRFSKDMADNLISAVLHGIYAGDIEKLSVRSLFPTLWLQEQEFQSITGALMSSWRTKKQYQHYDDLDLVNKLFKFRTESRLRSKLSDARLFTFKRGVQQLVDTLAHSLAAMENVTIRTSTAVTSVTNETDGVKITSTRKGKNDASAKHDVSSFNWVINTMSPHNLLRCISKQDKDPDGPWNMCRLSGNLDGVEAVTVAVVSLYYRTPNLLQTLKLPGGHPRGLLPSIPLQGFGYLIPKSVPIEQNAEHALGVIFDSDATPGLHTTVQPDKLGTKLTVMLGGHWWNEKAKSLLPSKDECLEMARAVLERHLGLTEKPAAHLVSINHDCIPQYNVGFRENMIHAHYALINSFKNKLRMAGSWFGSGVGMNDCVRSAHDVVRGLALDVEGFKYHDQQHTGLEKHAWGRPLALVRSTKKGEPGVVVLKDADAEPQGYYIPSAKEADEMVRYQYVRSKEKDSDKNG